MNRYTYDGPVMEFNTCLVARWKGITYAESENKARNNLTYQFKKMNHKLPNSKINLPGKILLIH